MTRADDILDFNIQWESYWRGDDSAAVGAAVARVLAERPNGDRADMMTHALREWQPCPRRVALPN